MKQKNFQTTLLCMVLLAVSGAFAQNDNRDFYEKNPNGYYNDHPNDQRSGK